MIDKYHGQEFKKGVQAQNVPPIPEEHSAKFSAPDSSVVPYAHVRMIGQYGLLCAGNQTLDFYNIALNEARQLRWDYFGVCGATMTCFDAQGNVVYTE
jgi:hypothetical protein